MATKTVCKGLWNWFNIYFSICFLHICKWPKTVRKTDQNDSPNLPEASPEKLEKAHVTVSRFANNSSTNAITNTNNNTNKDVWVWTLHLSLNQHYIMCICTHFVILMSPLSTHCLLSTFTPVIQVLQGFFCQVFDQIFGHVFDHFFGQVFNLKYNVQFCCTGTEKYSVHFYWDSKI